LQVFALDGRLVRHDTLPPVERHEMEAWLAKSDQEMKERHEVFTPGIWWFSLAVDSSGAAWSVLSCDRAQSQATLLQVPLLGKSHTLTFHSACCALPLAIWHEWLIQFSDPVAPREVCNSIRRIQ
jgi:hypothetical protein